MFNQNIGKACLYFFKNSYFSVCPLLASRCLALAEDYRVSLQEHREDNEADAHPEGEAHFLQLAKEDGRYGNAVERLQIVRHVHRKRTELAQGLELEEERDDGEHRAQEEKRKQVVPYGHHRFGRIDGPEHRYAERKEQHSARQLVHQHGGAVLLGLPGHVDVQDGEQRVQGRTEQSQGNAQTITHIDAENEQDARYGDEAQKDVFPLHPPAVHDGVEQRGEEARGGHACHPDGHVRCLYAGKECHPVQGEQDAASAYLHHGFPPRAVQFAHASQHRYQYDDTCNHSVPHQRQSAQGYQSPENTGPSGQEYRNVQYHQGKGLLSHNPLTSSGSRVYHPP